MRIGILGTGRVGSTLGRRWLECGHQVCWGSRDKDHPRLQSLVNHGKGHVGSWHQAIVTSEVVLMAVPWRVALEIARNHADLFAERMVIDCTNPIRPDLSGLELSADNSVAECLAGVLPKARLVKAFNMVSAATMANPNYDGVQASLFYCGDDTGAKQHVAQLAQQLGFRPIDAGPLQNARLLESVAMLYIYLACHGWGSHCALSMLTRSP